MTRCSFSLNNHRSPLPGIQLFCCFLQLSLVFLNMLVKNDAYLLCHETDSGGVSCCQLLSLHNISGLMDELIDLDDPADNMQQE